MVAHDLERDALAGAREADPVIGRVADEPELIEALQHRRHRRGRDAEAGRERGGADRALAVVLERVDRLRVVLDRLGGRGTRALREPRLAGCACMRHCETEI